MPPLIQSHFYLCTIHSSVQFSRSVMSDSLQLHGLQHTRLPCFSPSPRACSNSCPLSQWCPPTISSSVVPFSSCLQSFPASESVPRIWWRKCWSFSFSINPSNEYSGLISFRMDWLDLLAVQGTLKSSPTPQFKSIDSLVLSLLSGPTLTSIPDYWEKTIALTRWTFVGKVMMMVKMISAVELYELLLYFGYLDINPFSDIYFANIFFHS